MARCEITKFSRIPEKLAQNLGGKGEAKGAGDVSRCAKAGGAIQTQAGLGTVGALQVTAAVRLWIHGFFGGINAGHIPVHGAAFGAFGEIVGLTEATAHLLQQWIGSGLAEISDFDLRGISAASGTA